MKILSSSIYRCNTTPDYTAPRASALISGCDSVSFSGVNPNKLHLGLDKYIVESLESVPDKQTFFIRSADFILDSLGVPKVIRPKITFAPVYIIGEGVSADYNYAFKMLNLSEKYLGKSHEDLFSTARHEIEHFLQDIKILRTEGLGDKAVRTYSKETADNTLNVCSEAPNEVILYAFKNDMIDAKAFELMKKIRSNATAQDLEDLYKSIAGTYFAKNTEYQKMAVKTMGAITGGSNEAVKAEKYFSEYINDVQYTSQISEKEAYTAELIAKNEYIAAKAGKTFDPNYQYELAERVMAHIFK